MAMANEDASSNLIFSTLAGLFCLFSLSHHYLKYAIFTARSTSKAAGEGARPILSVV